MSTETDVTSLMPEQYTVGLSAVVGVTVLPGQVAAAIKIISGGSLAIVSGLSSSVTSGFLLDVGTFSMDIRGTFYLAAAGSTVVCHVLKGRTSGF